MPALILFSGSVLISVLFPREVIHIEMNNWHLPLLDYLFLWWTRLGEGWVLLGLAAVALLFRIRISLVMLAGYILSGLSAQLLKRLFFSQFARPVKYFELHDIDFNLYLVPGVDFHSWYSFPSGHTAAAFGTFFGLSLFLRSEVARLALFLLAAGVAFSRIYLSQHFLMDVAGGMFLGLAGGYLGWRWIGRYRKHWIDSSLPQLFRHENTI